MFEGEDIDADLTDDDSAVLPCPSCGQEVYEDAQQCPHCGAWITPLATESAQPSWVRMVGAIVAVSVLSIIVKGLLRLFR